MEKHSNGNQQWTKMSSNRNTPWLTDEKPKTCPLLTGRKHRREEQKFEVKKKTMQTTYAKTGKQDPHTCPDARKIHNLKTRGCQIASLSRPVIGDDWQVWDPGRRTVLLVPSRREGGRTKPQLRSSWPSITMVVVHSLSWPCSKVQTYLTLGVLATCLLKTGCYVASYVWK